MANVWAKSGKRTNLYKILSLLKENKELMFKDLSEKIGVSNPTLTEYLKLLESRNEIEHFDKPEDRRSCWYRIKPESEEKVTTRLRKYEAVHFIEEIHNPVYNCRAEKGISAAVFLSQPPEPKDKKMYEDITRAALNPMMLKLLRVGIRGLKPGTRMAVVLMIEDKDLSSKVSEA